MSNSEEWPTKVWNRFEKTLADGQVKKFVICNLPLSLTERAMALMREHFVPDEPVNCAIKKMSEERGEMIIQFYGHFVMAQGNTIVCFEDNDVPFEEKEIIGINLLFVNKKSAGTLDIVKQDPFLSKLKTFIKGDYNIYEDYKVKEFLTAHGLCVRREYRGYKIGLNILNTRPQVCRELGLNVIETVFSTKASQALATKLNYKLLKEIKYPDLRESADVPIDSKYDNECLKIMVKIL